MLGTTIITNRVVSKKELEHNYDEHMKRIK